MSVVSVESALELRLGKRLVFTNGVFDIIHAGHVRYLEGARSLGDLLIVGVNSDSSVRRLKGPSRPINPFEDRAQVLSALRAVDAVVGFEDDTPIRLIEILRPEVHVKGGDYKADELPECQTVHSYGGEVVILPLFEGRSSTKIIEEMRER